MTKKKTKGSENPASQRYEDFLRSVRLMGIGMTNCRCSLDREAYFVIGKAKDSGLTRTNAEYKLIESGDEYFDTTGTLSLTIEDKNNKREVLSVTCTYEVHFHAKFDSGSGFPGLFTKGELRLVLWPYLREFVSNMTSRMAVRPVTLPLSTDA